MQQFARLMNARLAAVFDINAGSAEEAVRTFPALRRADSLEDLLADPNLHAVVIATPAESHKEIAVAALEAGKDVLLEKPMAHTSEDALAVVEAAEARPERILMVGHCERFNRAYIDAKKAVEDGHVGTPRFISAARLTQIRLGDPSWKLGVLDTAVHDIDIILWLMQTRPIRVAAQGTTVRRDWPIADHVIYQIQFEGGALAQGHIAWIPFSGGYPMHDNAQPRLFLAGTAGILSLDLWKRPVAVHSHETGAYFWPDDVLIGYGDYFTEVTAQNYAFLQAVSTRVPPSQHPREAYEALRVAHAAHVSLTQREGAWVSLC